MRSSSAGFGSGIVVKAVAAAAAKAA